MYPHAKLLLYDLKLIDLVLSTNMDKTVEYSFIKSWLSEGILTSKCNFVTCYTHICTLTMFINFR